MTTIKKVAVRLHGKTYSKNVGASHDEVRRENGLVGKGRATRGFLDSSGKFLNREEALAAAKKSGQFDPKARVVAPGKLHSNQVKKKGS
jgi:hypothetical protein